MGEDRPRRRHEVWAAGAGWLTSRSTSWHCRRCPSKHPTAPQQALHTVQTTDQRAQQRRSCSEDAHLAARGTAGVVHHDAGVLKRVPLALQYTGGGAAGQQYRACQCCGALLQLLLAWTQTPPHSPPRTTPSDPLLPPITPASARTFLPTASRKPLMPMQPPKPTVPTSDLMCLIVSWMARQGTTCVG